MREERNKAESVPARSEERRPRRSRSREAFRQRQKELAESRGQEKRVQENGGQEKRVQEKRVQENKLQENRVQDTPGGAKTKRTEASRKMTARERLIHREKVLLINS